MGTMKASPHKVVETLHNTDLRHGRPSVHSSFFFLLSFLFPWNPWKKSSSRLFKAILYALAGLGAKEETEKRNSSPEDIFPKWQNLNHKKTAVKGRWLWREALLKQDRRRTEEVVKGPPGVLRTCNNQHHLPHLNSLRIILSGVLAPRRGQPSDK